MIRTAVLVLLVAGCGNDAIDLSGVYEVVYHTRSDDDCEAEGPAQTDPPYFRLQRETFFDVDVFTFSACDGPTEDACEESAGLLSALTFQQPVDGGWLGEVSAVSVNGANCELTYAVSSARLQDDGTVRIVARTYGEALAVPAEQCKYQLAELRNTSMPCVGHQVMVGRLTLP